METVLVKLVIFKEGNKFCGYCPVLTFYINDRTSENDVVDVVQEHLYHELCHRLRYDNLKRFGWEVSENSVKVPIFTDEKVVCLTEQLYESKIVEPKIIVINVGLPNAINLW